MTEIAVPHELRQVKTAEYRIMGSEVDSLYSAGMNGYLSKPLSPQALLEVLAPYTENTSKTV